MEKYGFVSVVKRLESDIGVRAVSTDRHAQIRKLMEIDNDCEGQ